MMFHGLFPVFIPSCFIVSYRFSSSFTRFPLVFPCFLSPGDAFSVDDSFVQAPDRQGLALYVALGSAIAFAFGWHVHEKAT